ncbi:hypothetical protein GCM10023175_35070 [Pseudonocardia xishanensis]|uniref:EthD domain-containing protein n=1 Tax=Pseudonocardia xishanensis TaxID=630995 RepID=A0ABP8RTH4_9PSEU
MLRHADTLGMIRYVQGHCRPGGLNEGLAEQRGTAEPFDGIADAWFADLPSMLAAAGSEAGVVALKELMADELRFIDVTRSCVFVVDEFELLGSGGCRPE